MAAARIAATTSLNHAYVPFRSRFDARSVKKLPSPLSGATASWRSVASLLPLYFT